jgi:hypothetical protein
MDKKQALEFIKQVLDAASKGGLFQNLESAMTAANAYQVISTEINKSESGGEQ